MRGISGWLRRHGWLLLLPAALFVVGVLVPDNNLALVLALGYLLATAAIVSATVSVHRMLYGTLAGMLAYIVALPLVLGIRWALGMEETLGEGETWFSTLIELPFWMTLFAPIPFAVALGGAALGLMLTRTMHGPQAT